MAGRQKLIGSAAYWNVSSTLQIECNTPPLSFLPNRSVQKVINCAAGTSKLLKQNHGEQHFFYGDTFNLEISMEVLFKEVCSFNPN